MKFTKKWHVLSTCSGVVLFLLLSINANAQNKLYADEFPMQDVVLLDGPFKHARDLNLQVLLKYDVDRMMAPYRKEAGLEVKAKPYPNWDGLDGHIAGHYLTAMAHNYASLGNLECKKRMEYMLSELEECAAANIKNHPEWGVGYVGGFPNSDKLWSAFKKGSFGVYNSAWAPFYNLHKMYAGLRDAWLYCGYENAKQLFLKFCDWGISVTSNLSDSQMQSILNMEHGGINEMFADAYQITNDEKYLKAAIRYSHNMLLDPMSQKKDNLDNKHANTQIPKVIGFERIAELTHDNKFATAGKYFWETVTQNRSLAFGGNSRREHFPSVQACVDYLNDADGPESCNTYNMLKLTKDLFRVYSDASLVDYYERALYNHILSTQHPVHGGYVYFTTARPRHYRIYSAPNEAMWCCVGSGMENHGKYNQFIYTHQKDSLFLNLFIASTLNWKEKKIAIKQETNFPYSEETKLTVTNGKAKFKLMVRFPNWVSKGAFEIYVNGKRQKITAEPSSFVCIDRKWKKGDVVEIKLPMHHSIEKLPNVLHYIAFMHGPILLSAKTESSDVRRWIADDSRFGQYPGGAKLPLNQAPILIDDNFNNLDGKLVPVKGKPLHFTLNIPMMNVDKPLELEPFFGIHDSRYMMYWMSLSKADHRAYVDSITVLENEKMELQKRTLDFVAPGEQQPEMDHQMESQNANKGDFQNEFYREVRNQGFFSYKMKSNASSDLNLMVRYWGAEMGNRQFEIYINDKLLVTEKISNKWNKNQFFNVEYPIPNEWLSGQEYIRVKFQAVTGNVAGKVFYVRLVRKK